MMKRTTVILATLTIGLPWTCFVGTEWEKSEDIVRRAQNRSLQNTAWSAVQATPVTRERRNKSIEERKDKAKK